MRRVLLPLLVVSCALVSAQELVIPEVLVAGDRVFAIHEPVLILGQRLSNLAISEDGRYVVIVRKTASNRPPLFGRPAQPPSHTDLIIWDSRSGSIIEIPLSRDLASRGVTLQWMTGTNTCVVQLDINWPDDGEPGRWRPLRYKKMIYIVTASNGRMKKVYEADENTHQASLWISPVLARAVLYEEKERNDRSHIVDSKIRILNSDGSLGQKKALPQFVSRQGITGWSPNGKTFNMEVVTPPEDVGRFLTQVLQYDLVTGDFEIVKGPVKGYTPKIETKEIIVERKTVLLEDGAGSVHQWWLKAPADSKSAPKLIVEHAEFAVLSPKEEYVLFSFKRALYVRRLQELSLEDYEQFLAEEARKEAMSKAKQVMLGLLMYSADYDDEIRTDLNFPQDILPYLKNENICENFTYTFAGGMMKDYGDPSGTIVGHIDTEYGRAIAYLDGHVGWEAKN